MKYQNGEGRGHGHGKVNIVIKFEAVIGNHTVPTLALEAGMNARVRDWCTQERAMKY